jgi:hypothetical protein
VRTFLEHSGRARATATVGGQSQRYLCCFLNSGENISTKKGFCFFCFKAGNGFSSLTELVLIICANHLCSSEYTLYVQRPCYNVFLAILVINFALYLNYRDEKL